MKKLVFLSLVFLQVLILLPNILAIDLEVGKISQNEVLIADLESPVAVFDINITNNGPSGNFEFYNLAGFSMSPTKITLNSGETKEIQLSLAPIGKISQRGFYTIPYFIRAADTSEIEESFTFKIIELREAFEVGSGDVDPESQSIDIFIKNLEDFDFGDVNVKFSSAFFNIEEDFVIGPRETKRIPVQLNQEDFKSLMAGFYTLEADLTALGRETSVEGVIRFVEKDILTTTKKDYGFLINTQIIEKTNEGNTITASETVIKKNLISRLFTSFSPTPDIVERDGFSVYYSWTRDINPGATLEIEVKTNWLFPLILILFVVAIVVFVRRYTGTNLVLRKRVSFVRAKGGEFALKVSVSAHARQRVERVNLVERLPPLVSLHEKFLGEQPTRVDSKNRRIEWNFEKMEAGEVKIVSYIVYSRVGVVGKFALPTATAIFEKDEQIKEVESNRAFFIAEQRPRPEE
ncbi:MAG TPA: hypothetical protein VJ142_00610 [Candidatus Nanoarchaeia archaeon]|nr:hypothetical protein [Candidatus Nanoarchaeia archaeon]